MKRGNYSSAAFTNASGLVVAAGASVEVRRESDNVLANLFADEDGVTPKTNPFTADADGRFNLYTAASYRGFKVTVTKDADTHTLRHVPIGLAGTLDAEEFWAGPFAAPNTQAALSALGAMGLNGITDRSSNTILGVSDSGKVFRATAAFTQTATAAATLGDRWHCTYKVEEGVVLTIDPNGSELIDGRTTKQIAGPASGVIYCTGTAFITFGFKQRIGEMVFWPSAEDVAGTYDCDGAAKSRTTDAPLFEKLIRSATATITIASPGVVTWTAHGLKNNMPVKFTTTGALPTGLVAGRTYWTRNKAANTFELAAVPGGAAINTSGSQSGTHTAIHAPYGDGDGSTTFNVPDMRDGVPVGWTEGAPTIVENFLPADIATGTDTITVEDNTGKWQTGMQVIFTTTGTVPTGWSNGGTYYVVRTGTNSIKITSSLANAQNGSITDVSSQGTGVHTITHTRSARGLGETLGEDAHAQSISELLSHNHAYDGAGNTGGGSLPQCIGSPVALTNGTYFTGGNAAANIMQPGRVGRWIIFYA